MKESNSSAKKRKRVSPRKEVAVVTFAAVASIAGVGGLLSVHQPVSQVAQPPPAHVAGASWSSSPRAPHSTASHTLSQGSKTIASTGQTTKATQQSSRVFERDTEES